MALPDAHGTPNRETVETLIDTLPDLPNDSQGKGLKQILEFFGGFQDLDDNNSEESKFVSDLKQKLFSIITLNAKILQSHDPQLVADVLECMRTSMSHAAKKQKYQLSQLWSSILNADKKQNGEILVMLFEIVLGELEPEAVLSPKLYGCLQELLQSDSQEERKSAIIVLKKLLNIVNENPKDPIAKQLKRDLKCKLMEITSYINVLETMEAGGSSDMVTSLASNLPLIKDSNYTNENWKPWIPIPYKRLLRETRNIVLIRWGLEYIMDNLTATELNDSDLLIEFLAKTNRLDLYNMEEYVLPKKFLRKFVDRVDLEMFFGAFTKIVWQQVPLHNWLNAINDDSEPQKISIEILLKLCEQVRSMNNHKLQYQCYEKIFQIFKVTIDSLSSIQYMTFLDAAYDDDVGYFTRDFLSKKVNSCENMKEVILLPNRALYKIFFPNMWKTVDAMSRLVKELSIIPKTKHGWWRLPPLFTLLEDEMYGVTNKDLDFYRNVYGVNIELVVQSKNLKEVQLHLFDKLECKMDDEKDLVLKWTTDLFFANLLADGSKFQEFQRNPIEILRNCSYDIFCMLLTYLRISRSKVDASVLIAMVDLAKMYYYKKGFGVIDSEEIYEYVYNNLAVSERMDIFSRMVPELQPDFQTAYRLRRPLPYSIIIKSLTYGHVKTGDDRIEAAYVDELTDFRNKYIKRRDGYLRFIILLPKDDVHKLIDELLRMNESYTGTDISLEYSMDHRIQLRIGRTLLSSTTFCKGYWSDQLWSALVSPNNHLNVSFIYECLVAFHMPSFQFLLDKLQDFSSYETRPQHSILSVVHIHCIHFCENLKENELQEVLTFLQMQLTHENPQTVLLTQLILQKIVDECFECRVNIHIEDGVQNFIESSLSNTILDTDMETRVKLPIILTKNSPVDRILHRTKVPFDEYNKNYEMI